MVFHLDFSGHKCVKRKAHTSRSLQFPVRLAKAQRRPYPLILDRTGEDVSHMPPWCGIMPRVQQRLKPSGSPSVRQSLQYPAIFKQAGLLYLWLLPYQSIFIASMWVCAWAGSYGCTSFVTKHLGERRLPGKFMLPRHIFRRTSHEELAIIRAWQTQDALSPAIVRGMQAGNN